MHVLRLLALMSDAVFSPLTDVDLYKCRQVNAIKPHGDPFVCIMTYKIGKLYALLTLCDGNPMFADGFNLQRYMNAKLWGQLRC